MPGAVSRTEHLCAQQRDLAVRAEDRLSRPEGSDAQRSGPGAGAQRGFAGRVTYPAVAEELGYEVLRSKRCCLTFRSMGLMPGNARQAALNVVKRLLDMPNCRMLAKSVSQPGDLVGLAALLLACARRRPRRRARATIPTAIMVRATAAVLPMVRLLITLPNWPRHFGADFGEARQRSIAAERFSDASSGRAKRCRPVTSKPGEQRSRASSSASAPMDRPAPPLHGTTCKPRAGRRHPRAPAGGRRTRSSGLRRLRRADAPHGVEQAQLVPADAHDDQAGA